MSREIYHIVWNDELKLYEVRTRTNIAARYDNFESAKAKVMKLNVGILEYISSKNK